MVELCAIFHKASLLTPTHLKDIAHPGASSVCMATTLLQAFGIGVVGELAGHADAPLVDLIFFRKVVNSGLWHSPVQRPLLGERPLVCDMRSSM